LILMGNGRVVLWGVCWENKWSFWSSELKKPQFAPNGVTKWSSHPDQKMGGSNPVRVYGSGVYTLQSSSWLYFHWHSKKID
jgi:hypothetical protein